jgi:glycosyltransferase involved in cell wall biosynthesis
MLHQPPGGIDHGPVRTAIQARLDRLAYRSARLLMVASEALADELVADGESRDRLRTVPPGRDVAAVIAPPPGDLRRGRQAAVLCVANWVRRKGIDSLLEAVARLPDAAVTLHLAGNDKAEPSYASLLRSRLARPDLADRVIVHGPLSTEEVAALYAAADLFALPSLKEPYGTVYGEAMAAGLPVVGWRAGNLPHLADHEQEGLLPQLGDLEELTQSLWRLAADPALRDRLGQAGRRRAQARPTWEESAALFFGTIREVVESQ